MSSPFTFEKAKLGLKKVDEGFLRKFGYMNLFLVFVIPVVIIAVLLLTKPDFIMSYPEKVVMQTTNLKVCYDEECVNNQIVEKDDLDVKLKKGTGFIDWKKTAIAFFIIWAIAFVVHVMISFIGIQNIGKTPASSGGFGVKSYII